MKNSVIMVLPSWLVLAISAAAAVTRGHDLAARVAARGQMMHLTHPKVPATVVNSGEPTNQTNVDYSSNWSGGVLTSPPFGTKFTSVTAQIIVPEPSLPSGATQNSYASAWVGIDGDTYNKAILQTGIDFGVSTSGQVAYDAWYEWYPDYAYDFSGITINTGDVVELTVIATSANTGLAMIVNLSNGEFVTQTLSAPSTTATLAGQNAEWIVEDFDSNGSQVPFADFGTVSFTHASAGTSAGGIVGTSNVDLLDIVQNGKIVTSAFAPSDSEVVVEYTGS